MSEFIDGSYLAEKWRFFKAKCCSGPDFTLAGSALTPCVCRVDCISLVVALQALVKQKRWTRDWTRCTQEHRPALHFVHPRFMSEPPMCVTRKNRGVSKPKWPFSQWVSCIFSSHRPSRDKQHRASQCSGPISRSSLPSAGHQRCGSTSSNGTHRPCVDPASNFSRHSTAQ